MFRLPHGLRVKANTDEVATSGVRFPNPKVSGNELAKGLGADT
jgi:hypothetical protein